MIEKEYIDLEETVTTLKRNSQKYFSSFHKGYVQAIEDLADIPAAKVAPVVRCKDCKNAWHSLEGLRCCIWATSEENCETEPDAFCSFGERKDG